MVPNLHRDDEAEYVEPRRRPASAGTRGPGQWHERAGRLRLMLSGVISGLLAGAVALGVAELIAGLTGPAGSPVVAVGGAAIDMTPIPVKDFAIAHTPAPARAAGPGRRRFRSARCRDHPDGVQGAFQNEFLIHLGAGEP